MRYTLTLDAPEGADVMNFLANLPAGWRVVEFKEEPTAPSLPTPHWDPSIPPVWTNPELTPLNIGSHTVVDDKGLDVSPMLKDRHMFLVPSAWNFEMPQPQSTIVGPIPFDTEANKVSMGQVVKLQNVANKHALPVGKHLED